MKSWKDSQVMMILKSGKVKLFLQNYGSITLLPVKVQDSRWNIKRTLEKYTKELGILPDNQFLIKKTAFNRAQNFEASWIQLRGIPKEYGHRYRDPGTLQGFRKKLPSQNWGELIGRQRNASWVTIRCSTLAHIVLHLHRRPTNTGHLLRENHSSDLHRGHYGSWHQSTNVMKSQVLDPK